MSRLVAIVGAERLPAGLLPWQAWAVLRTGPVFTAEPDHPQLPTLAAAGVVVEALAEAAVAERVSAAGDAGWLGTPPQLPGVSVEVVDAPGLLRGARLVEVVSIMDRLRSPGGCPWDAEQTHASLARHLLEEAYEAVHAIEEGDPAGLREELGDVLLQVAFHARLAEEAPAGERFDIDDVAGELAAKLVRRHPHVFGQVHAEDAAEVSRNWEMIKAAEKSRRSVTEGLPLALPALALTETLQRRAERLGAPVELVAPRLAAAESPAVAICAAAAEVESTGPDAGAACAELLFTVVAFCRARGVEPETALRERARRFRDALAGFEHAVRAQGGDPAAVAHADWHRLWAG